MTIDLTPNQAAFLARNPHLAPIANLANYGMEVLVKDMGPWSDDREHLFILTESCYVQSVEYWQSHNAYDNPTWLVAGYYGDAPSDLVGDCTCFMVHASTDKLARDYVKCFHPDFHIVDCKVDPY